MLSCLSGYLRFNSLDTKHRTDLQRKFSEITRLLPFFWCNPGNGSFPALFLPPGSSVSAKSLIDIKGKHPGCRVQQGWTDCLGSAGLARSSYRGTCICPGPILVGLVGPVVPREKLGRAERRSLVRTWRRSRAPAKQSGTLRRVQVPDGCYWAEWLSRTPSGQLREARPKGRTHREWRDSGGSPGALKERN